MKPAYISDNGSAKKTENTGHFKLPKHCFIYPHIHITIPRWLTVGQEMKFFSQNIFLMQKQRKLLLLFKKVLDLKFFLSARDIEPLQMLYLEFLVCVCPKMILVLLKLNSILHYQKWMQLLLNIK